MGHANKVLEGQECETMDPSYRLPWASITPIALVVPPISNQLTKTTTTKDLLTISSNNSSPPLSLAKANEADIA